VTRAATAAARGAAKPAPAGPTRAAIYTRVSTADQVSGTSLPAQLAACQAEIERRGWVLAEHYCDEGVSGADRTRPAWLRMLSDANAGQLDAVVVAKLDRFGRKVWHALQEIENLEALGVTLVSVKEQADPSTPHGRMMLTMLASVAEMERDTILDRTVTGQRNKARAGGWPGGKPPYGWRLEGFKKDVRPVPDEAEREILDLMYRSLVRKRLNSGQISDLLNASGFPSRTGEKWSAGVVRRILANPSMWDGIYRWGQVDRSDGGDRRHHKTRINPRTGEPVWGEQVNVRMPNPPWSKHQFEAAQRALGANRKTDPAQPVTRLLSGRLFGECGAHYTGTSIARKDYDVYRCTGNRHRGKGRADERCGCHQVHEGKLDARVWAVVCDLLSDPARLDAMARDWLELPADDDPDTDRAVLEGVKSRAAKLERAIERAKVDHLMADDQLATAALVTKLQAELADLRAKQAEHEARHADARLRGQRLTDLARLAERAAGRLQSMASEDRREVLDALGVTVHMGEIVDSEPRVLEVRGQIDPRLFEVPEDSSGDPGVVGRAHKHTGTVVAAAFAAVLYRIVTGDSRLIRIEGVVAA
jgi:site-specific DNA recombinase